MSFFVVLTAFQLGSHPVDISLDGPHYAYDCSSSYSMGAQGNRNEYDKCGGFEWCHVAPWLGYISNITRSQALCTDFMHKHENNFPVAVRAAAA